MRTFSFSVLGLLFAFAQAAGASTISVSGRQLLVNCAPFLMRGMNYSPAAIGQGPGGFDWYSNSAMLAQDVAAMKAMGVNTVRVYLDYGAVWNNSGGDPNNDTSTNPTVVANVNAALALFQANGIWAIVNYWLPYNEPLMSSPNPRQWEELKFQKLIQVFKGNPDILLWVLGNENNASFNRTVTATQYFNFVQEAVAAAKVTQAPPQPIAVVLAEVSSDGVTLDHQNATYLGAAPAVDLWGVNVYQSPAGYVTAIDGYTDPRPLFLSEFGQDAWNNNTNSQDLASQASYYQDRWSNYIGTRLSALNGSNKLVGACAFEWNDEWYKDPAGTWGGHDYGGYAIANDNDNYSNEEWYGLSTALAAGVAGPRSYRNAYTTLQGLWTAAPYNVNPPTSCCLVCTATPTATPTVTPNPCAAALFDGFESLTLTNAWGGSWGAAQQDNATYAVTTLGSYSGGGLNYGFNTVGQWSVLYSSLGPTADPAGNSGAGSGAVDLSPYGQISFWVKTNAPGTYYLGVASNLNLGPGSAWYHAAFTATGTWTQVSLNLDAQTFINPGSNVGTWAQNETAATQFTIIPPAGVTGGVLNLDQVQLTRWCGVPTATATPTPFGTPTATPNPCLPQTIDDFENGTINNVWGGAWGQSQGVGNGSLAVGPGGQSGLGLAWSYNTSAGYAVAYMGLNPGANPQGAIGARDLSFYGQARFWVKASAPGAYLFKVAGNTTQSPGYAWYQAAFNAGTAWTQVSLNLDATTFSNPGGNTATWAQTLAGATQFVIQAPVSATATLQIDGLQLVGWCGLPSPTPSASPSFSPTPTRSPSPSVTPTPTGSPSPAAATASPSVTASLSATASPSVTVSPSVTASPSAMASPSASPTLSASPTVSSSPSPSCTVSPVATATVTPTGSSTWTPVPPGSSPTATPTVSPSFSASPSVTDTATPSATPSGTPSATASGTPSATPSGTPSATPSGTPSATPTGTPSVSPGPTASASASPTPSPSVSGTFSPSPSPTSTFSPSATPLPQPTVTASPSPAPGGEGPTQVAELEPCPNPNPTSLAVRMEGPADRLEVAVYSEAMNKVLGLTLDQPLRQGWNQVSLGAGDRAALAGLPAGLYFLGVRPWRNGQPGFFGAGAKLLLLH